jgi:hypothetical protein
MERTKVRYGFKCHFWHSLMCDLGKNKQTTKVSVCSCKKMGAGYQWLVPITLVTWEAEIGRIEV